MYNDVCIAPPPLLLFKEGVGGWCICVWKTFASCCRVLKVPGREDRSSSVLSPRRWASHLQTETLVPCLYAGFATPDRGFNPVSNKKVSNGCLF